MTALGVKKQVGARVITKTDFRFDRIRYILKGD